MDFKSTLTSIHLISFRLTITFNDIVEFGITDLFLYTLLSVASSLLTFQYEIVEFFLTSFLNPL